jgi:hypothetical protein
MSNPYSSPLHPQIMDSGKQDLLKKGGMAETISDHWYDRVMEQLPRKRVYYECLKSLV